MSQSVFIFKVIFYSTIPYKTQSQSHLQQVFHFLYNPTQYKQQNPLSKTLYQKKMGNIRQKPHLEKHTTTSKKQLISYTSSSMCGWRQFMQDAHLEQYQLLGDQYMSLFAIFDGHGGPEIALFAKHHFLNCLLENGYFITKNYEKALCEVFLHLDALMTAKAGQKQLKKILDENSKADNANLYEGQCIAGSTANVVLLTKQYVYCANAGDSRAMAIMRDSKVGKPKFRQLSTDHKPDEESERKRIVKAGGTVVDGRINQNLNLSRALGDFAYKKNKDFNPEDQIISAMPDIVKVSRKDVAYIFMGCDGVWQSKSCEAMTKWLHKKLEQHPGDLGRILEALLDEEVSKSADSDIGMDNMTAILVQLRH